MKAIYYACGGVYRIKGEKKFRLTSPSGENQVPYITDNLRMGEKLFWHSQHISHLYRLEVDLEHKGEELTCNKITAILVSESWECIDYVGAVSPIELNESLTKIIFDAVTNNKLWSI